jgi:hypothetical protein
MLNAKKVFKQVHQTRQNSSQIDRLFQIGLANKKVLFISIVHQVLSKTTPKQHFIMPGKELFMCAK